MAWPSSVDDTARFIAKRYEILIDSIVDPCGATMPYCNGRPSRYLNNNCRAEQAQVKPTAYRPQTTSGPDSATCAPHHLQYIIYLRPRLHDLPPHEYFITHFCYGHAPVAEFSTLSERQFANSPWDRLICLVTVERRNEVLQNVTFPVQGNHVASWIPCIRFLKAISGRVL